MKAVHKTGRQVSLVDAAAPEGEGVRVRVASAGICGSDLHLVEMDFPVAGTLGHEIAGFAPDGRAVAVEPLAPCGACERCRGGDYNLCVLGMGMALGIGRDGGMTEEVLAPARSIVPLPAGVRVQDACLIEPLAVCAHGLRIAGLRGDQRVAIVGAGTIGLCAAAAVASSGAPFCVKARHDHQREAAVRLGAEELEGEFDLVIDAAGTRDALAECLELARPGGTLLLLGSYWHGFELPGILLSIKEVRVVPSIMYGRAGAIRDFDVAAALLAGRPEIADVLVTHRFPLDAAVEAFQTAGDRAAGAIKVVLEP
jgi:threonine dehydrogenase-like Zn-dependent dehydrogenase